MKLGFVYGATALGGRLIDFKQPWTDKRGLTGSELSCIRFAGQMVVRGHDVTLYVDSGQAPTVGEYRGIRLGWPTAFKQEASGFDAVCIWNEPTYATFTPKHVLTLVDQQLNDFNYCQPHFDDRVDVYTSPSEPHREWLLKGPWQFDYAKGPDWKSTPSKWEILPNGCDPREYGKTPKVQGRVVYISSPDRGLHHLLYAWPKIRARAPRAELRLYYHGLREWIARASNAEGHPDPSLEEQGKRARFIARALSRLEGKHGVTYMGSSSRAEMAVALDEAEVLAYPCDTVSFTEGFSVSTLEGCASGALPVITGCDSLESIYGGHAPMVPRIKGHEQEWEDLVVKALTDKPWADVWRAKAKAFAETRSWAVLAEQLEEIIVRRLSEKKAKAA